MTSAGGKRQDRSAGTCSRCEWKATCCWNRQDLCERAVDICLPSNPKISLLGVSCSFSASERVSQDGRWTPALILGKYAFMDYARHTAHRLVAGRALADGTDQRAHPAKSRTPLARISDQYRKPSTRQHPGSMTTCRLRGVPAAKRCSPNIMAVASRQATGAESICSWSGRRKH